MSVKEKIDALKNEYNKKMSLAIAQIEKENNPGKIDNGHPELNEIWNWFLDEVELILKEE